MSQPLYKYTRENALEDGYFADVSHLAHLMGFHDGVAVAVTSVGILADMVETLDNGQEATDETQAKNLALILMSVGTTIQNRLNECPGEHLFTECQVLGRDVWASLESTPDGRPAINIFRPSEY